MEVLYKKTVLKYFTTFTVFFCDENFESSFSVERLCTAASGSRKYIPEIILFLENLWNFDWA